MAIFKRFFGTDNPYEALMVIQDAFEKMGGSGKPELGAQRTHDLPVTLEEILPRRAQGGDAHEESSEGGERVDRERGQDADGGRPARVQERPTFVFEREGTQTRPSPEPSSLYSRRPRHALLTRSGDDLVYVAKLSVVDALCGTTLKIQTLDKRTLAIPVVECVDANSQKIVGGEGCRAPTDPVAHLYRLRDRHAQQADARAEEPVQAGFSTRVSSCPRSSTRRASPSQRRQPRLEGVGPSGFAGQ